MYHALSIRFVIYCVTFKQIKMMMMMSGRKVKVKVKVGLLAIALLTGDKLVCRSALQSQKWQLIGMN